MNILFCIEKYCDGKSEMGLSNNQHNLLGSLKHSLNINFNVVYYDEIFQKHNKHIDDLLPKICERNKTDIVIFSLMNNYAGSPTIKTFELLKKMNIKTCIHWPDTGLDWGYPQIEQMNEKFVDIHIGWDNADSEFHKTRKIPNNFLQLFVPQDPHLYYKDKEQEIPISFVGSLHMQERQIFLDHAINKNGLPIIVHGGQRKEKLTHEQYAKLIRNSKISINFPFCNGGFDQAKGRIYEVLASCSMLLERKNNATNKIFKPGYDYVEYDSPDDFVEKIKYYLNNDTERSKIAEQGYNTYNKKYNAKCFWEIVLNKMK